MATWINNAKRLKVDISYFVQLHGGFAVGSGFRRGLLQKTVLRDEKGLPLLPASMLKGRARDAAERLAHALGISICESSPAPERMCSTKSENDPPCLVCRTFGTPGRSSNSMETGLIWRDAQIVDEKVAFENYYTERTHAQISRRRGIAMEQHLYSEETAKENLRYHARIRGWLTTVEESAHPYPEEVLLLLASLRLLNFVGGGKSRGLGSCSVTLEHVDIGEETNVNIDGLFAKSENLILAWGGAKR